MRILQLYPELAQGTGGIQVYNKFLAETLTALGHDLRMLSINDASGGSFRHHTKAFFSFRVFKTMAFFRPDLILCGHINFSPLCLLMNRIWGVPFVTFAYGVDIASVEGMKGRALRRSIAVVCISNHTRERLQRHNIDKNKTFLIPNTFDPERFKPGVKPDFLAKRWNIQQSDVVFLTVARMKNNERYKGYDRVILALKKVMEEIPAAKYLLVGDGDDIGRVRALIAEHHLTDRVLLPGFVPPEELPHYYHLADAFVMPSSGEGFGFVFLEAAACGKPVIAGNKDGSVDAVCNGRLGLLIDPEDTSEIAQAMIRIAKRQVDSKLLDPSFLHNEATERFGLDRFKERVHDLLHRLHAVIAK
jgi:glycosyltransferase involved in cell wall biosynthesis